MLQSIFVGPLYFPVMWQWPLTLSKDAFYNFINSMIEESKYCSDAMKKYFNKELVMTKEDNENFKNSTKRWICDNDFIANDIKYVLIDLLNLPSRHTNL